MKINITKEIQLEVYLEVHIPYEGHCENKSLGPYKDLNTAVIDMHLKNGLKNDGDEKWYVVLYEKEGDK